MTFEKLSKLMFEKFGTDKLSDIALEFKVSPQVVSNWKARNQVPYKYVKVLRSKIVDSRGSQKILVQSEKVNEGEEDFIKLYHYLYNLLKVNTFAFLSIVFTIVLSVTVYTTFIQVPMYKSVATVVPISSGESTGIGQLAQQFGMQSRAQQVSSLSSAKMIPDIFKSRSLMKSILFEKLTIPGFADNQFVINLLLNREIVKNEWNKIETKVAISKLLNMIDLKGTRLSPTLIISAVSENPTFSTNILEKIIEKITSRIRSHKLLNTKKTSKFISDRLSEIKLDLEKKEEKLKAYRESNRLIASSPALLLGQERLTRDLQTTNQIYGSMKMEFERSKIQESQFDVVLEVLDYPEASIGSINKNFTRSFVLAIFIGLFIAILFIVGKDLYNKFLKN